MPTTVEITLLIVYVYYWNRFKRNKIWILQSKTNQTNVLLQAVDFTSIEKQLTAGSNKTYHYRKPKTVTTVVGQKVKTKSAVFIQSDIDSSTRWCPTVLIILY